MGMVITKNLRNRYDKLFKTIDDNFPIINANDVWRKLLKKIDIDFIKVLFFFPASINFQ